MKTRASRPQVGPSVAAPTVILTALLLVTVIGWLPPLVHTIGLRLGGPPPEWQPWLATGMGVALAVLLGLINARDLRQHRAEVAELRRLALTDPLTGVANRRAFEDRVRQVQARSARTGNGFVLVYADVDRFKSVNDNYGHAAGDAVLAEVARRLRSQFRTQDTVARLGGDEFAVVCEDAGDADRLRRRVHRTLALPYRVGGHVLDVTVSVGCSVERAGSGAGELLERADAAMYDAKRQLTPVG